MMHVHIRGGRRLAEGVSAAAGLVLVLVLVMVLVLVLPVLLVLLVMLVLLVLVQEARFGPSRQPVVGRGKG
jgi:hypothetical protein